MRMRGVGLWWLAWASSMVLTRDKVVHSKLPPKQFRKVNFRHARLHLQPFGLHHSPDSSHIAPSSRRHLGQGSPTLLNTDGLPARYIRVHSLVLHLGWPKPLITTLYPWRRQGWTQQWWDSVPHNRECGDRTSTSQGLAVHHHALDRSTLLIPWSILNEIPRKLEVWTSIFQGVSLCASRINISLFINSAFTSSCLLFILIYISLL